MTRDIDWLIEIFMVPRGQARPRARAIPSGRKRCKACGGLTVTTYRATVYKDDDDRDWENEFGALAAKAVGDIASGFGRQELDQPLRLDFVAIFARTQELLKRYANGSPKHDPGFIAHDVKPDKSNIAKAVEDALQRGGVLKGDQRIFVGCEEKVYATLDDPAPRIVLRLRGGKHLPEAGVIARACGLVD